MDNRLIVKPSNNSDDSHLIQLQFLIASSMEWKRKQTNKKDCVCSDGISNLVGSEMWSKIRNMSIIPQSLIFGTEFIKPYES